MIICLCFYIGVCIFVFLRFTKETNSAAFISALSQNKTFCAYYHHYSSSSLLHLCPISRLSDMVLFILHKRTGPRICFHTVTVVCWRPSTHTHRNSSPTYPMIAPGCIACLETERQTDKQTGQELRGQGQMSTLSGAWRLWSDTAIRSGAPAPPARLERRWLRFLSVWETGPSMSKPFIALASYCFSLLGGYYESTPSTSSGMASSFLSHNLGN